MVSLISDVTGCTSSYRFVDVPAGTYAVTVQAEASAATEYESAAYVMKDLEFEDDSIVETKYVIAGGSQTITVTDGQYVELFAAVMTNGQMALEVNQKGYDVVSSKGERISVKTTAAGGPGGHVSFNPKTLSNVDRVIILRVNAEEREIETLNRVSEWTPAKA